MSSNISNTSKVLEYFFKMILFGVEFSHTFLDFSVFSPASTTHLCTYNPHLSTTMISIDILDLGRETKWC